jgi:protein-tyrosine phosphatase
MAAVLAQAKGMLAESAGIDCGAGLPAADNAVAVMRERGLDLAGHRSRDVQNVDFSAFDLVVAMTRDLAFSLAPLAPRRLVTWDVNDPYRCPIERYRQVADQIDKLLTELSYLEHDTD